MNFRFGIQKSLSEGCQQQLGEWLPGWEKVGERSMGKDHIGTKRTEKGSIPKRLRPSAS